MKIVGVTPSARWGQSQQAIQVQESSSGAGTARNRVVQRIVKYDECAHEQQSGKDGAGQPQGPPGDDTGQYDGPQQAYKSRADVPPADKQRGLLEGTRGGMQFFFHASQLAWMRWHKSSQTKVQFECVR